MSFRTLIQVTLNAGLMKPRKEFTRIAGRRKPVDVELLEMIALT